MPSGVASGFIQTINPRTFMQNSNRAIGQGALALVGIVVLYYIWNYLIAFLAVVGAVQVYHVCRKRLGR